MDEHTDLDFRPKLWPENTSIQLLDERKENVLFNDTLNTFYLLSDKGLKCGGMECHTVEGWQFSCIYLKHNPKHRIVLYKKILFIYVMIHLVFN